MIRKSIKILSSVFFMIFVCLNANSQTCEVLNQYTDRIYTKEEVQKLESRVCEMLKKENAVPEDNKISIYYIPDYDLPSYSIMPADSINEYYYRGKLSWKIKKSDFFDGTLLKNLSRQSPVVLSNQDEFVNVEFIVTNSTDSLIAYGDARQFFVASRYTETTNAENNFILKKIRELNINYLFSISNYWLIPVFGVTDKGEIVVITYDKGHKVYSIKDFIDLNLKDKYYKDRFYD